MSASYYGADALREDGRMKTSVHGREVIGKILEVDGVLRTADGRQCGTEE